MQNKVFVSGCFDLLHSGHIAFFKQAAAYGELYVAVGSDKTILSLKGRVPINTEEERVFVVSEISTVKEAFVSTGHGALDFEPELKKIKPDKFIVNEDGNLSEKRELCRLLNIEYIVLKRESYASLPVRSSTDLKQIYQLPYRIDLAGGWLDQPFVSKLNEGSVITASIEMSIEFNERSGMASSTRRAAAELWGNRIPDGDYQKLAKVLFCYDNPPGKKEISGSQDSIGLVIPGLCKSNYKGGYWPSSIDRCLKIDACKFVEDAIYMIPLNQRPLDYNVLENTRITPSGVTALADAAEDCWNSIMNQDIYAFGKSIKKSFDAQTRMFPNMMNKSIMNLINKYASRAIGWKVSGAGGGGYFFIVSEKPIKHGIKIFIRRGDI